MSCEEYLILINGHLDSANTKEEERVLNEHLANCPLCRQTLSQMTENDQVLRASQLIPPKNLVPNVMSRIRKESANKRRRNLRYTLSGLATAAVLLLVIFGVDHRMHMNKYTAEQSDLVQDAEEPAPVNWIMDRSADSDVVEESPLPANRKGETSVFNTVFLFVDVESPLPHYDALFPETAEILMNEDALAFYRSQEQTPVIITMLNTEQLQELECVDSKTFSVNAETQDCLVVIYTAP